MAEKVIEAVSVTPGDWVAGSADIEGQLYTWNGGTTDWTQVAIPGALNY